MARTGRKPQAEAAVERLDGSPRAKQRLAMIIKTMRGELTVPQACQELGIGESRFHELRNQWLQEALQLLEPRRIGRPPKSAVAIQPQQVDQLQQQVEHLKRELVVSEVRREVGAVLPQLVRHPQPTKKGISGQSKHLRHPR